MCISVIVPVYKVEKYLARCVDSILSQTFTDFELILVDDGSPDNCPAMCDEYAKKDSRVRVIHQKNSGLSAARNAGLEIAVGTYVFFADSDDYIHPACLELLLRALEESGAGVSIASFARTQGQWPEVPESDCRWELHNTEDFYTERITNSAVAWGKLYRRADFANIRYPVGKIHEDEYTTYKILFRYDKIAFVPGTLYYYFQNPEGITGSQWSEKRLDLLEALDNQMRFFAANGYTRLLCRVGSIYLGAVNSMHKNAKEHGVSRRKLREIRRTRLRIVWIGIRKHIWRMPQDAWLFEEAYPRTMKLYWYGCAAKRKLLRQK